MLIVCGADIPTIAKYNPSFSYYGQSYAGSVSGRFGFHLGLEGLRYFKARCAGGNRLLRFLASVLTGLWYVGWPLRLSFRAHETASPTSLCDRDMKEPRRNQPSPAAGGLPGMWREGARFRVGTRNASPCII